MEIVDIERPKLIRYAGLFAFLLAVYGVGLSRYINFVLAEGKSGAPVINTPLDLMAPITGFCILSGLAFAALAGYDENWNSGEAAVISVAAWAVVAEVFLRKLQCHCYLLVALPFVPFLASATIAHAAGRATRFVLEKTGYARAASS